MSMRFLIVGAGGFLARSTVEQVASVPGAEVVTVGRGIGPGMGETRHHSMDCADFKRLARIIADEAPDRILNLAGSSGPDFGEMVRYNVQVSETILSSAARLEKPLPVRVVLAGSAAEFGNPATLPVTEDTPTAPCNSYGVTKVMQTQLALYFRRAHPEHLRITVARLFNLIGPGSPERLVFGSFVSQIATMAEKGTLLAGNIASQRDFLHVKDAAAALVAIAELSDPAPDYVLASGRAVSIRSLLDFLIEISGREIEVTAVPSRLSATDVPVIFGNSNRIKAESGWQPTRTAELAIEEMWEGVSG